MRRLTIAAIPGDGIGPEVIAAGLEVLEACARRDGGFQLDVTTFDWGSEHYRRHGVLMPPGGHVLLRAFDAILFGAVGAPDIPDHLSLWGLRLAICQPLDQYANVRPIRLLPGIAGPLRDVAPADLDWVIVRENSEGEYAGQGGRSHRGLSHETATEVALFTRAGVTRIMRYAFALAQRRPRKLLTVVTKSNAQRFGLVMWDEIAAEVAAEFRDVTWDRMLVDAMTMRMVLRPATLDTIVATNLHADILSDLAAALAGSLGIAPTANLNPERDVTLDVRADSRLGLRHRRRGHRQPDRHLLVGGAATRASKRGPGRCPADAGHREGGGRSHLAYARSRRRGHHTAGHRCRVPCIAGRQSLGRQATAERTSRSALAGPGRARR